MKIRILPMSFNNEEFVGKTIEEVQLDYFGESLVKDNKYWYNYSKQGLTAKEGDLLLFQMDNRIIASGIYSDILRFKKTDEYGNHGAIKLKKDSIRIFKPITKDELSTIISGFKSFRQVKYIFNIINVDMDKLESRMNIRVVE
jgi:hypothetical protein